MNLDGNTMIAVGIGVVGFFVVLGIILLIIFHVRKKRLMKKIEEEYE